MNKQRGFSLIEMLIVVVIVGIITAFAYPSYLDQVRATKRADCSGALVSLSNAMERFYTVNSTYVGAAGAGGAPLIFSTRCPIDGGAQNYTLTIPAVDASTYLLQATPVGDQVNDKCGSLTFSNTGRKDVVGEDAGVTWQQCWR